MLEPFLKIRHITKSFPGVKALDDVSFDIQKGEIHVLVGENGAGKSTLLKILTGAYQADEGEIYLNGKKIENNDPIKSLHEWGIVPIYQELNLIPQLDIAENIFLGREIFTSERFRILNRKVMLQKSTEFLQRIGLNIDPTTKIEQLGIGRQQMVEIAKALSIDAKIIILDEPTAALGEEEIEKLFSLMRQLKNEGITLIFVSHKLEEVKEIGDSVTILRDGKHIITANVNELSEDEIIRYMVGRNIENKFLKIKNTPKGEILRVKNLTNYTLKNVSFNAYRGEILGIAGLIGAGRTELARAIVGADKIYAGEIFINGKKVEINSPEDAIKHGIVLLPEDRKAQGLSLVHDVKFNCTISNLGKYKNKFFLNTKKETRDTQRLIKDLSIKTPSVSTKVEQLSGGNQQKLVIAKWLNTQADIFIFDEPTRGIDVGAKVEIYKIINRLVAEGKTVIMISSELPEILGMSDRILVMHEGEITAVFSREEATQEKILEAAIGGGIKYNVS